MILPILNVVLIVAIAVVGIASFFLPGKGIAARKPTNPEEEQEFAAKRKRAIVISVVLAVGLIVLLIVLGTGSLSGAAGGAPEAVPPSPEEELSATLSTVVIAAVGVMLIGAVGLGLLLAIALAVIILVKAPSRIRKIFAFSAAILTALLVLSIASYVFSWGWNFPDIFGTVGGILSLVFLINDRYLSK